MSNWFDQAYTGHSDDLEKTAQAMYLQQITENPYEFLAKVAEAEQLDLSEMDEEQLEELAQALVEDAIAQEQAAAQGGMPEGDPQGGMPQDPQMMAGDPQGGMPQQGMEGGQELGQEEMAKVAEAETLGRIMAHSYVDELSKIAEQAQVEGQPQAPQQTQDVSGPLETYITNRGGSVAPAGQQPQQPAIPMEKAAGHYLNGWRRRHGL